MSKTLVSLPHNREMWTQRHDATNWNQPWVCITSQGKGACVSAGRPIDQPNNGHTEKQPKIKIFKKETKKKNENQFLLLFSITSKREREREREKTFLFHLFGCVVLVLLSPVRLSRSGFWIFFFFFFPRSDIDGPDWTSKENWRKSNRKRDGLGRKFRDCWRGEKNSNKRKIRN